MGDIDVTFQKLKDVDDFKRSFLTFLTIKPKDRCPPRFVTKIEGSAVEESCKVFFEGIVDAQPNPKFNWYFNDEPIVPGIRLLFICFSI